jgi:hypothetical protein
MKASESATSAAAIRTTTTSIGDLRKKMIFLEATGAGVSVVRGFGVGV